MARAESARRSVAAKPNRIITYEFGISPRTVEVYRGSVMTKMPADNLTCLVRMVLLCDGTV